MSEQQVSRFGRDIALQCVGAVELAQKTDSFVLGGRVVSQVGSRVLPDLLDGPSPVHEPDHPVRSRREAVEAPRRQVLEHIPGLASVLVSMNLSMAAQPGLQPGHPVPQVAEEGFHVTAAISTRPAGSSRSPDGSKSRSAIGDRSRSFPPLPSRVGATPGCASTEPPHGSSSAPLGLRTSE